MAGITVLFRDPKVEPAIFEDAGEEFFDAESVGGALTINRCWLNPEGGNVESCAEIIFAPGTWLQAKRFK